MLTMLDPTSGARKYPQRVRKFLLGVVSAVAVLLYLFPQSGYTPRQSIDFDFEDFVENLHIPETRQLDLPPPRQRPSIPVISEDEDYAEELTIPKTVLEDLASWELPPLPDDAGRLGRVRFIPYDEPPFPIGGYEAIKKAIKYPEMALEAHIEGTVIVQIFVTTRGYATEVFILRGVPGSGMNEAVIRAVRRTRFRPARQRDIPIGVWVAIPIQFKLN